MTQAAFGALIGMSQQAVSDLIARGVLDPAMVGQEMLHAYCAHLREVAAGRHTGGKLNLVEERAGLARAQRERLEMQNAVTRGELAPVVLIEEVLAKAGARISGVFDAIPGAVRRRVPALPADEIHNIAKEIARARNIVASMSLADLREPEAPENEPLPAGAEDEES